MTAEPRMEELLASIRKAIHEDIGDVPAAGSGSNKAAFTGAMRELRVRVGDEVSAAQAEIKELREKINRTRASENLREPSPPPLRRLPPEEPAPALRPSFAETLSRSQELPRREARSRFSREAETVAPPPASWPEEPQALPPPGYRSEQPTMMSAEASAAAQAAFSRLADSLLARATNDRSLEDMAREMLRGMLKQWLDENLPTLVERLVREEIERVARRGR